MKVNIFYSWQSDLPNNKNRGLIDNCIAKAVKQLGSTCSQVTEFAIEMDSRNTSGTPDLVSSIFEKIDDCDIFIADISIINFDSKERLMPNPNVLLELGYAAKTIGWSNIICIFNSEFANIEDLPFDIRFRKPVVYNTRIGLPQSRCLLNNSLLSSIEEIVNTRITDKKDFLEIKRVTDLKMQNILIDLCRVLYETEESNVDRFNYSRLLNSSFEEIEQSLKKRQLLGFHLFKNVNLNIKDFIDFFNDELETYFLSAKEKRLIAKMVYSLRRYEKMLQIPDTFEKKGRCVDFIVSSGYKINSDNSPNSYLLLKPLLNDRFIVVSGGEFSPKIINILLDMLEINENYLSTFSQCLYDVIALVNDWIKLTGNYFIANQKPLSVVSK